MVEKESQKKLSDNPKTHFKGTQATYIQGRLLDSQRPKQGS